MQPNPLLIFGMCLAGAAALVFLFWLNHQWVTRGQRKDTARPAVISRPIAPARPSLVAIAVSYILGGAGPIERERVNHSQPIMSPDQEPESADDADGRTDGPSVPAVDPWLARLEVDRTRTALIELLVYSEWTTAEIRAVLKGANDAIGIEVEQARQRLGIKAPDRQLKVRDQAGERLISLR